MTCFLRTHLPLYSLEDFISVNLFSVAFSISFALRNNKKYIVYLFLSFKCNQSIKYKTWILVLSLQSSILKILYNPGFSKSNIPIWLTSPLLNKAHWFKDHIAGNVCLPFYYKVKENTFEIYNDYSFFII